MLGVDGSDRGVETRATADQGWPWTGGLDAARCGVLDPPSVGQYPSQAAVSAGFRRKQRDLSHPARNHSDDVNGDRPLTPLHKDPQTVTGIGPPEVANATERVVEKSVVATSMTNHCGSS